MVGGGGDRALVGLEDVDDDPGRVGQERAAPAAGRKGEIGVSAITDASSGRIGPLAERL